MEYMINAPITPKSIYPSSLRLGGTNPEGVGIGFTNYYMELGDKPFFAICGEFHYSRYPESDWGTEIAKMKISGINVMAFYIFWNHHEETEGSFNWQGNRDLRKFIKLCERHGLYVILRVGPFCHGEVRNGGLPDWLFGRTFDVRSNDEGYMHYVRRLFDEIGKQAEGMMYKDGGPVIGIQLENELYAASALWELTAKQGDEYLSGGRGGSEGREHMRLLKQVAVEAGLVAPIYTSTGWGAAPLLEDEVLPLYGGYAYTPWSISADNPHQKPTGEYVFVSYHDEESVSREFQPKYPKSKYPFACCEMGGGMQTWYLSRFQVEPVSVVAMSLVKIAGGCNFVGYYMFHGGTNPIGKTGYLNESTTPRITYDFQAPIGEFGQIRPSNDLLRPLHYFLHRFGDRLAPLATVLPDGAESITPDNTDVLRYAIRSDGNSGYLFINNYQDHVNMRTHENVRFTVGLGEHKLSFPRNSSLDIRRNTAMMLPFNFDLDGLNLQYATAQPVTFLESDLAVTFFFGLAEGIDGEFTFDTGDLDHICVEGGKVEREPSGTSTVVVERDSSGLIRITREGKREIRLYVMSAKEAAALWETEVAGKRRVFFSEVPLIANGSTLEFLVTGEKQFAFREFIQDDSAALWKSISNSDKLNSEEEGQFRTYTIQMPVVHDSLVVERLHDHKVVVRFDGSMLQDVDDILLSIEYTGNVGYAFSGGQLFHDHFHNGAPWEIGLSRFRDQIRDGEIVLETTPLRKGTTTIDADAAMAVEKHFTGEKQAVFHRITSKPIRRITLHTVESANV
ncbi:beta-galactosidase [Paenibacillus sp. YIM B09110]|uniref:beta-galactosidase n=1 Tax=Paenibacillus sp. YIM B09110 TaxID=3126102 RepID=UPI00301D7E63